MNKPTDQPTPIAHATTYRRVTLRRLATVLGLTGFCELCGANTLNVAFFPAGVVTELCSACAAQSGLSLGHRKGE